MTASMVGFIGAGNMAEAIARALTTSELYSVDAIRASDPAGPRRNVFRSMGIDATPSNVAVVGECPVVIMAVKPQNLPVVLAEIGGALTGDHLLISICAGCPASMFEAAAGAPVRVVRVMPNTPLMVGLGATAIAPGLHATEADLNLAQDIFAAAGKVVRVGEHLMDAVTAVSGSGPAYFYYLVEAMTEAGTRHGLGPRDARDLAVQTARGAAEMMAKTGLPPDELRRRVTSKGGTTEAALRCFEERDLRQVIADGITAAVERGRELGKSK